jgi:hypothetical protein
MAEADTLYSTCWNLLTQQLQSRMIDRSNYDFRLRRLEEALREGNVAYLRSQKSAMESQPAPTQTRTATAAPTRPTSPPPPPPPVPQPPAARQISHDDECSLSGPPLAQFRRILSASRGSTTVIYQEVQRGWQYWYQNFGAFGKSRDDRGLGNDDWQKMQQFAGLLYQYCRSDSYNQHFFDRVRLS